MYVCMYEVRDISVRLSIASSIPSITIFIIIFPSHLYLSIHSSIFIYPSIHQLLGILETIYVKVSPGVKVSELKDKLIETYRDEPFVHVLDG